MGRARDFAARGEQGRSALVLDASAADTDVHENILLDGTDSASKNAGFNIMQEDFSTDVPLDSLPPGSRPILNDDLIWFHTWYGQSGSQSISDATTTKCNWNAVRWDWQGNANMIDDPSVFTVPVSGFYYLRASVYYSISAHNSLLLYNYIYPRVNGSTAQGIHDFRSHGYGGGSGFAYHQIGTQEASGIIQLNKGDTVDVAVYFYKNASAGHIAYTYKGSLDGFSGCLLQRLAD